MFSFTRLDRNFFSSTETRSGVKRSQGWMWIEMSVNSFFKSSIVLTLIFGRIGILYISWEFTEDVISSPTGLFVSTAQFWIPVIGRIKVMCVNAKINTISWIYWWQKMLQTLNVSSSVCLPEKGMQSTHCGGAKVSSRNSSILLVSVLTSSL